MYRCNNCRKTIESHTLAAMVTVETRPKTYPFRPKTNRYVRERKIILTDDAGGTGTEIVREIVVCPTCETALRAGIPTKPKLRRIRIELKDEKDE